MKTDIKTIISSLLISLPNVCQAFFSLSKSWHRFLSKFSLILTNLCQTYANPWHGFLQARQWGRAKVVPRLSTINEETCANANLYI